MQANATVGGHITLAFTVDTTSILPRSQGSLGIGFSIEHGVTIHATQFTHSVELPLNAGTIPEGKPDFSKRPMDTIEIYDMDNVSMKSKQIYLDFLEACRSARLIPKCAFFEFKILIECPVSQGFGMSAAGLMAMSQILHQFFSSHSIKQFYTIAHRIERHHGAGLGDVLGASVGGVERRMAPGAPFWPGQAESFECICEVLLVWSPHHERHTSLYIDDPIWKERISSSGTMVMADLLEGKWTIDRWDDVLNSSQVFAQSSGMLEESHRATIYEDISTALVEHQLQSQLAARLCMLGTSVVVLPQRVNDLPSEESLAELEIMLNQLGYRTLITRIAKPTSLV